MINPNLDDLMKKVDSKYTLVVVGAKRAREITENALVRGTMLTVNPVSLGLADVVNGKINWERTKSGIK